MATDFLSSIKSEIRNFAIAPIYPFLQRDWPLKMWVFVLLSYIPFVNVIVARGWRKEYVHRISWGYDRALPNPIHSFQFLLDGIKLWLVTGIYIGVPIIIIVLFGLDGVIDLISDLLELIRLFFSYFFGSMTGSQFSGELKAFIEEEFINKLYVFLIENIYLVIYVPMYRIAMIRYSITGRLIRSHMSFKKNVMFFKQHFWEIILIYVFNAFNFFLILVIDFFLMVTVIGSPLIPIVTFFVYFWVSGYEYGLLGRYMIREEKLNYSEHSKLKRKAFLDAAVAQENTA